MASGEGSSTLNERLERAISKLGFWYRVTIIMVVVGLVALSGIISMSQIYFHQEIGHHGVIEEIIIGEDDERVLAFIPLSEEIFSTEGIVNLYLTQIWLMVGNGIVIGILSFLVLWVTYRGNSHQKEFESIERQFIRQSYLVNFETSVPEGDTRVEKIINHASLVFPTLKELSKSSRKKNIKENVKINGDVIDAIISTKKGDFVIKFFDDKVTYDKIKELCSSLSKSRTRIFRVLFVARDFEEQLQSNQLVDMMDNLPKYFKTDLIFEEDQGYSMLWID